MGIFDWLKSSSPSFKAGPLKTPTKFDVRCSCGKKVAFSIPTGMAEPSVLIQCSCGKGEVLYVL